MVSNVAIWLDGVPGSSLPLPDRGFDYGDGIFETILLENGCTLFREAHLERLRLGLVALSLPDCSAPVEDYLDVACADIARRGWAWAALRVTITRGTGERGYAAPAIVTPRIIMSASQIQRDCREMSAPASLVLADIRLSSVPLLAGVKHLNRLEQVLAATQARQKQADESLLLNQHDQVVSVAAGNLFLVRGEELLTPPLATCPVAGTRRRIVIDRLATDLGLCVNETGFGLDAVASCDELFITNSLFGLRSVKAMGATNWTAYPVCEALFQSYLREMDLCAG